MSHDEAIQRVVKHMTSRSVVVLTEMNPLMGNQYPDVLAFGNSDPGNSIMVEVKVSRTDFLKEWSKPKYKKADIPDFGRARYIAMPESIFKPSDLDKLPRGYGMKLITSRGVCNERSCFHHQMRHYTVLDPAPLLIHVLRRTIVTGEVSAVNVRMAAIMSVGNYGRHKQSAHVRPLKTINNRRQSHSQHEPSELTP